MYKICGRHAEDQNTLKTMLEELNTSCEQYGMKINVKKTKVMIIGRKDRKIDVQLAGERIEQVDKFRYLGCVIRSNMRCEEEIKVRIAMAKESFNRRRNIFCESLNQELRKR